MHSCTQFLKWCIEITLGCNYKFYDLQKYQLSYSALISLFYISVLQTRAPFLYSYSSEGKNAIFKIRFESLIQFFDFSLDHQIVMGLTKSLHCVRVTTCHMVCPLLNCNYYMSMFMALWSKKSIDLPNSVCSSGRDFKEKVSGNFKQNTINSLKIFIESCHQIQLPPHVNKNRK